MVVVVGVRLLLVVLCCCGWGGGGGERFLLIEPPIAFSFGVSFKLHFSEAALKCLHGGRRNYQDTLRCMGPMDLNDCPIRDRLFLAALEDDSRQALYTAGCVDRPGERLEGGGAA